MLGDLPMFLWLTLFMVNQLVGMSVAYMIGVPELETTMDTKVLEYLKYWEAVLAKAGEEIAEYEEAENSDEHGYNELDGEDYDNWNAANNAIKHSTTAITQLTRLLSEMGKAIYV